MFQLRNRPWRPPRLGAYGAIALIGVMGSCAPVPACQPVTLVGSGTSTEQADPVQTEVVRLVNEHRKAAGLPALTVDSRLYSAAKSHSNDQAARNTMSHTGSDGSDAGARLTAAGYQWSTWAENVAAGQPSAAAVVSAWMASAPHRANILSSQVTQIGVANAAAANGTLYWTMDLARPR